MRLFILLSIQLISASAPAQNGNNIMKIEFQSLSRVYAENLTITPDSLIIRKSNNRGSDEKSYSRILKNKDWKMLLNTLKSIPLQDISTWTSPTNKRTFDGARHSRIAIYDDQSTYEHLFDDENPHDLLKPLMKRIGLIRSQPE